MAIGVFIVTVIIDLLSTTTRPSISTGGEMRSRSSTYRSRDLEKDKRAETRSGLILGARIVDGIGSSSHGTGETKMIGRSILRGPIQSGLAL